MRTHRIAIVIKPDLLKRLDDISKKNGVKRAGYVSDIVENFVSMEDLYDKVMDKNFNIISVGDLMAERLKDIELVIDDNTIITDLEYDPGAGTLNGRSEIIVCARKSWYKRLIDFFLGV